MTLHSCGAYSQGNKSKYYRNKNILIIQLICVIVWIRHIENTQSNNKYKIIIKLLIFLLKPILFHRLDMLLQPSWKCVQWVTGIDTLTFMAHSVEAFNISEIFNIYSRRCESTFIHVQYTHTHTQNNIAEKLRIPFVMPESSLF